MIASATSQVSRVVIAYLLGNTLFLEHLSYFLALQVDGRHHDVARFLSQELDDTLTQVGLHHVDTMLFQVRIHLALLGEHRFRLHHFLHVMVFQDAEHNLVKLLCILRPMHLHATALQVLGKHFQIISQMGDGMHLDFRCMLTQVFPLRQFLRHFISFLTYRPEGSIMPRGLLYVLRKPCGSF